MDKQIVFGLLLVVSIGLVSAAIEIDSCGVLNISGETYTLNKSLDNITTNCFLVNASNITFNGNGNSLLGDLTKVGVYVRADNFVVKSLNITNFKYGIYLRDSDNSLISLSILEKNTFGVRIRNSSNNLFRGIEVKESVDYDIYLESSSEANRLLNTTYSSESVDATSSLSREWFTLFETYDQDNNPLGEVNISSLEFEINSSEAIVLELCQYKMNGSLKELCEYNVSFAKEGYDSEFLENFTVSLNGVYSVNLSKIIIPVVTEAPRSNSGGGSTQQVCGTWTTCEDGTQTSTCDNGVVKSRSCEVVIETENQPATNEPILLNEANDEVSLSPQTEGNLLTTGAVIGNLGVKSIAGIVVVIVLLVGGLWYVMKMRNSKKGKKEAKKAETSDDDEEEQEEVKKVKKGKKKSKK